MNNKCARCGKDIPETKYLIQTVVYLGDHSPRVKICDECYDDFVKWFDNVGDLNEQRH